MNTKDITIRLIWYPDFFRPFLWYLGAINLNHLFWNFIFSDKILSLWIIKELSEDEKNNFKYILKNITLAYEIFFLYSKNNPQVNHLFYAINIITQLLNIINKNLKYEEINFYGTFRYKWDVFNNIEETLIYKFLDLYKHEFDKIEENSILYINIQFSEQINQIKILQYFFKKIYKNIYFHIDITHIIEFENKLYIKKIILNSIENIVKFTMDMNRVDSISEIIKYGDYFLWHKNINVYIFNRGCYYRKCTFCNIWKMWLIMNNESKNIINNLITTANNGLFDTLHIDDPDIQPEEITYISQKFIDHNVNLKIHIRTRFSKKYNRKTLEIMYKWWVRFMGVWLESASPRLNKLINKYENNIWTDDFDELIKDCFEVGINIHIYTIFWFPTETKKEINMTKKFLLKNFKQYPYFTYTAWSFWLNRWTYIYNNPEKFNLKIKFQNSWVETFISSFYEKNIAKNSLFLVNILLKLENTMFFKSKFLFKKTSLGNLFWSFIENSRLFHMYKMYYSKNPFLEFWQRNNWLTKRNYKNKEYKLMRYYQIIKGKDKIYIKNRINFEQIEIQSEILLFLEYYDEDKKLIENLEKYNIINQDTIYKMVQSYFFLLK